jgi:Nif-specific regulatory protein
MGQKKPVSIEQVHLSKLPELLKFPLSINSEKDLLSHLKLLVKEAANSVGADGASVFLLDRENQELWSIVTLDGKQIRLDARLGLAGSAAMTGETINVKNAYEDERFFRGADEQTGYHTKSILIVPLVNQNGDVIGTFQALNKKSGNFTHEDEDALKSFAENTVVAIENSKLLDELKNNQDRLLKETVQLRKEVHQQFSTRNLIGFSEPIQNVVRLIDQISDTQANVLMTGESGTGKELVSKIIHYNSTRSTSPFVALNCAALPESLVESELFGIEKGVATGVEARIGKFEEANGGTLLLDEIGDLSLAAQAKILRVLQENVIERVGGRKSILVDVRIIAATNKDLESAISRGEFRQDLYYRLRVITIQMPALRDIQEDIPIIINHFLEKYCAEMNKELKRLTPDAFKVLSNCTWPGNVRELENKIKRLVILTPRKIIKGDDLPESIRESSRKNRLSLLKSTRPLKELVEELERQTIQEVLEQCDHNQIQAARILGLSRQGLINKMKRYDIKIQKAVS